MYTSFVLHCTLRLLRFSYCAVISIEGNLNILLFNIYANQSASLSLSLPMTNIAIILGTLSVYARKTVQ